MISLFARVAKSTMSNSCLRMDMYYVLLLQ